MFKNTALIATLVALSLGAATVNATVIDMTKDVQGEGNKGVSFRPWTDATHTQTTNFVVTARTGIDENSPYLANAAGDVGTVFIEKDGKGGKLKGAGVQTITLGGSKGISGGGGDCDEELIFTYDNAVALSSVTIYLGDIEFGDLNKSGEKAAKDDPVIFLKTAGSNTFDVTVTESDIYAAFNYIGDHKNKYGQVNFNSFITSAQLAETTMLSAFKVRETNGHLYVSGGSENGAVPEPATMTLLALGGVTLLKRRRRGAKA